MNINIHKFDIKFLYNFCIYSDLIHYYSNYLEFQSLNDTKILIWMRMLLHRLFYFSDAVLNM